MIHVAGTVGLLSSFAVVTVIWMGEGVLLVQHKVFNDLYCWEKAKYGDFFFSLTWCKTFAMSEYFYSNSRVS